MGLLGSIALYGALISAVVQIVASVLAGRSESPKATKWAEIATYVTAALVSLGAFILLVALINKDWSLLYVADYTSNTLSLLYRIGAMWAGQGGSLLLWAWIVSLSAAWVVYANKRYAYEVSSYSYLIFGLISGLFVFLSHILAKVFEASPEGTTDGFGLNPLLQDPLQIIHPLMLYGGYVLYAVPFALVIGALLSGKDFEGPWLRQARTWGIVSWIFLTGGIVLGARWAYAELGWGGYWAWDPVENASLIPWLSGTVLLHNGVLRRGANRLRLTWSIALMVTFNLCLFGTFLTRSGVIQSVHAFGESNIGPFLGGAILVFILLSGAVVIWRLPMFTFKDEEKFNSGWFGQRTLAILLWIMTVTVIAGTVYPLFARVITGQEMAVTASFFRWTVTPMGVALLGLFAVSPFIKAQQRGDLRKEALIRLVTFAVVAAAILGLSQLQNPGVALVIGLSVLAAITVVQKALPKIRAARAEEHAIWHAIHATAPYIGHLGLVIMLAGITVNQAYEIKSSGDINLSQTAQIGHQSVRLDKVEIKEFPDRASFQATISFIGEGGEATGTLVTMLEQFANAEQLQAQVGILTSWDRDLYVVLDQADASPGAENVRITLYDAPGMVWIWVGGFILTLGGIIYVIPWRRRKVAGLEEVESDDLAALLAAAVAAAKGGNSAESSNQVQSLLSTAKQLSGGEGASDAEVLAFLLKAQEAAKPRQKVGTAVWVAGAAVLVAVAALAMLIIKDNQVPGISGNPTSSATESASADPAAIADLQAKIEANPKDTASMWDLLNILYPAQMFTEAAKYTKMLTEQDPTNPETWYANARVAQQAEDRQTEFDSWQKVIELAGDDPDFVDAYFDLGFWYWSADPQQKDKAVENWKILIKLAPDSDMAQMVAPHIEAATASPSS